MMSSDRPAYPKASHVAKGAEEIWARQFDGRVCTITTTLALLQVTFEVTSHHL